MRGLGLFLPALLLPACLLGLPAPARGDAGGARSGAGVPVDNPSHVHDDDPWLTDAFARAASAEAEGLLSDAVERLQAVIARRHVADAPLEWAPYVVAVDGRATYEGAWLVARHRLASGTAELRAAYKTRFEAPARKLLQRALERLDAEMLAEAARLYLGLEEGRQAALTLADMAAEQGDLEAAFARLEALEDLEEVSAEATEVIARWRSERIARQARLLARRPVDAPRVAERLEAAALAGPGAAVLDDAVPAELRRRPPLLAGWPTTGGQPDRAGRTAPLTGTLGPLLSVAFARDAEEHATERDTTPARADRPSPWVAPRAVVGRDAVFVFDGEVLRAFARDGSRELAAVRVSPGRDAEARPDPGEEARDVLPLVEGHALTLDETSGRVARLYVSSTRRTLERGQMPGTLPPAPPRGELVMVRWDGERLLRGWRISESPPSPRLPPGMSVFGAPCLHMGFAWIAGVRASEATSDQVECWLFGLDPATGEVQRRVRLGSGSPWRFRRLDEAVPSSPAAAHGRVVVATALGWVAAVDAEDGRLAWIQRYDRTREVGRLTRLSAQEADLTPRLTGFANEPPLIAFGVTVVAPTDANHLLGLATRPRGARRHLMLWDPRDRRSDFERMAVEAIVGVVGGDGTSPATIVVTGKGDADEGEPPGTIVAGLEPVRGQTRWSAVAATGHTPTTFGRAALVGGRAYVPTLHGLLVVDAGTGRVLTLLDASVLPEEQAWPASRWFGTLVPIPGQGLAAVNEGYLTLWRAR